MINIQTAFTLINPQNGNLGFKLFWFDDDSYFDHLQRHNYYTLVWVTKGRGKLKTNFGEYDFEENTLLTFSLYQPYLITTDTGIEGVVLNFHPDFFLYL